MKRVLPPSAALLWGLQFAFLNPALALLLVALYDATPAQIGWVLAAYNASGFLASLALPAFADRTQDYLSPMLVCGLLTLALAGLLAATSSLPVATIGLIVLGGPAGVGSSLLFAQLKHSGAGPADVVNTRAVVSFAWVAGPPLATVLISVFGDRAILLAIAVVATLNAATSGAMLAARRQERRRVGAAGAASDRTRDTEDGERPASRAGVVLLVVVFVALQATNNAAVSVMSLFVTRTLGLDVVWAGAALGVAAGLEIPALMVIGRLAGQVSSTRLIASGCLAGIAYYAGMTFVSGPVTLIGLQVLNAWFFGVVAGVGLTLFQSVIPRPGLASGLFVNTRRLGAIASGPIIGIGSATPLGYSGVFVACAALTVLAVIVTGVSGARRER